MNRSIITGRIANDLQGYHNVDDTKKSYVRFKVAASRQYEKEAADFIPCVAFGKTAEFILDWFRKGDRIGVEGSIRTGSYEKDGKKIYTTEVNVANAEFVDDKKPATPRSNEAQEFSKPTPEEEAEGLPFM